MKRNEKLKLFICYSHSDEEHIKEFIKHIAPLKSNGLIDQRQLEFPVNDN